MKAVLNNVANFFLAILSLTCDSGGFLPFYKLFGLIGYSFFFEIFVCLY